MQYIPAAALAFALGASARPHFSGDFPSYPFSIPNLPYGPYPSAFPGGSSSEASGVQSSGYSSFGSYGTFVPTATGTSAASSSYAAGSSSAPYPSYAAGSSYAVGSSFAPGSSAVPGSSYAVGSSFAAGSSDVGGSSAAAGSSYVAGSSSAAGSSYAAPSAPASFGAASSAGAGSSVYASSPAGPTSSAVLGSSKASSGGGLPASSGSSALSAVQTVAAGESFDCGMVMYDRGVDCTGQEEGGDSDAVFMLENGASLSNCIIGPNQIEGVHCEGNCQLTNVWWSAVCEDAFTIKEQGDGETTTITGGGAFGAEDKVLQHNGGGTLSVSGFTADNFGKVYRSCGNCDDMPQRHVIMDDITATGGSEIAGINSNYGDTATLTNIKVSDVDDICVTYTGNDTGDEPEENGSGPSEYCIYDESDITET